jgi:hypothetical protein
VVSNFNFSSAHCFSRDEQQQERCRVAARATLISSLPDELRRVIGKVLRSLSWCVTLFILLVIVFGCGNINSTIVGYVFCSWTALLQLQQDTLGVLFRSGNSRLIHMVWRSCSFTIIHSLTSRGDQPFASCLGRQWFGSWGCSHTYNGTGFSC